ncbi:GNAT family N-acetyltransferase [Halobacteriaceae archaeon SHR40]|uniref:GNAT family N-acetyltransferase n=1 Tax=Halovenus amylolytica TaxID=2500550 RepID=UPI000FE4100B
MLELRRGTRGDLDRLRQIQARTLAEPWPELLASAVGGYPPVFVAVDHQPVGYAIVIHGPETVAYLSELAVAPDRQGEGYGSKLLEYVCEELAADGYDRLRLSVLASDERARQFYSDCGFEQVERLPDEFERGDGILLAKELTADSD